MHFCFLQKIKLYWVFEDKNKDVYSVSKLPKKPGKSNASIIRIVNLPVAKVGYCCAP
jgi:hypothetical protein